MMSTCVVLAGHGSRNAEANTSLKELAAELERTLGERAYPAFLEMAEPSIETTIKGCVVSGAERVVLVPYFLHPGMHVRRDLVEIIDAARLAYPAVRFEMSNFFGSHPGVPGLLADLVAHAVKG